MALKGLLVLPLLLFSCLYNSLASARDLKNLDKFKTNNQVARINETYFSTIPRNFSTNGYNTLTTGWQTYYNSGEYHGASAKISLWEIPNVKPNSVSQFAIAVGNQGETGVNVIMAGFHVYPGLYKNNDLHFFTYWSTSINGKKMGCYNNLCPGFRVADEANLHLGQSMAPPLSTYNGNDISLILTIQKDTKTQDWLLYMTYPGKTTFIGWWPHTLFTTLSGNANMIQFSGSVSFDSSEPSPPMGSGHVAIEGDKKAAYFKQVTIFDKHRKGYYPSSDHIGAVLDKSGCYTVSLLEGGLFYYGGPGGCKIN